MKNERGGRGREKATFFVCILYYIGRSAQQEEANPKKARR